MTNQEISKCVERGAKFLDKKCAGWAAKVNLETFDFLNSAKCPLGQLYGDYSRGLEILKLRKYNDLYDYGFSCTGEGQPFQKAWIKQIKQRLTPIYASSFFVGNFQGVST